jgi:hypothetical protein
MFWWCSGGAGGNNGAHYEQPSKDWAGGGARDEHID